MPDRCQWQGGEGVEKKGRGQDHCLRGRQEARGRGGTEGEGRASCMHGCVLLFATNSQKLTSVIKDQVNLGFVQKR